MKRQYLKDEVGSVSKILLPIVRHEKIIAELEDAADVLLYDEAKKEDDGERVSLSNYKRSRTKL